MAILGINSRAVSFRHFSLTPLRNHFFPTFLTGDAARELTPRTTIGEFRGRAHG